MLLDALMSYWIDSAILNGAYGRIWMLRLTGVDGVMIGCTGIVV